MNPFKNLIVKAITGLLGVVVTALVAGDCAYFLITGDRLLVENVTEAAKQPEEESFTEATAAKAPRSESSSENEMEIEDHPEDWTVTESFRETEAEILPPSKRTAIQDSPKEPAAEQLIALPGKTGTLPEQEEENPLLLPEPPKDGLPGFFLRVNRTLNCITAYTRDENGEYTIPYKAIVCSTGRNNRTPLGTFTLQERYRWRNMLGGVWSQYATRVYRGVMMHSVPYYTKNQGNLEVHQYNRLGEQASAGCIRMSTVDAMWVYYFCPPGTQVEVYEDAEDPGPLGKPEPIRIEDGDEHYGWDPTDPDYPAD